MMFLKNCESYLKKSDWQVNTVGNEQILISKEILGFVTNAVINAPVDFGHYRVAEISGVVDLFDNLDDIPEGFARELLIFNGSFPVGYWEIDDMDGVYALRYTIRYIWDGELDVDWEFFKMSLAGLSLVHAEYNGKELVAE